MASATHPHVITAPTGSAISCKGWHQEAALRMLMNNLDPAVAERPEDLVVYGGGERRLATGSVTSGSSAPCGGWRTMKHYWCRAASLSGYSGPIRRHHGF